MSYNISSWNTKKIDSLSIPLGVIQGLDYTKVELQEENRISAVGLSEMFQLTGVLEGENVQVSKICTGSEGSGSTWESFVEMLRQSKGELIATQVWEGGDSITKLTVKDGKVIEEDIEI